MQEGVEFRRKGADIRRSFILIERLCPVSVDIGCDGAVRRRQLNRHGVRAEYRSPSRGFADFLGVGWELNCIYGIAPYLDKESLIHRVLKPHPDPIRYRQRAFLPF